MPDDALERVLRLVAEGRLTADEAGPILDALEGRDGGARGGDSAAAGAAGPRGAAGPQGAAGPRGATGLDDLAAEATNRDPAKTLRVEVTDGGRAVINLRIPLSLGRAALNQVPGISDATSDRIREAIDAGIKGPIVDVDDGDDGVRISLE
jgi:SHOCT-like protein